MYIELISEMPGTLGYSDCIYCISSFEIKRDEEWRYGTVYYYSDNTFKFYWISPMSIGLKKERESIIKELVCSYYVDKILLEQ